MTINLNISTLKLHITVYIKLSSTVLSLHYKFVTYVDLGLVVVSAVFGLALSQVGQRGDALVAFFQSLLNVTMVIINWFMW